MKALAPLTLVLLLAACATPSYWTKPGATRPVLAHDTEACYRAALSSADYPSALSQPAPSPTTPSPATARSTPPSELWTRAPRDAGFERFDERLRYEKCMADLGYQTTRPAPGS
jgi:hypothetical protein